MNEDISIVYVDDEIDIYLSKFLLNEFKDNYSEIVFKNDETSYQDLIDQLTRLNANIVIIDSRLFENGKVKYKFTGEELKMAFRKIFPFMETIVITQNDYADKYDDFEKYRPNTIKGGESFLSYYQTHLDPAIMKAKRIIEISRNVISEIGKDSAIDLVLVERLKNEINGLYEYKDLTKKDVDQLIKTFKEMKKELDDVKR